MLPGAEVVFGMTITVISLNLIVMETMQNRAENTIGI